MNRKVTGLILAAACAATVVTAPPAEDKSTLKMATLAPKNSPWGKVFTAWTKAVKKKSNGSLKIQWLWNGTAGPESGAVGKVKSGQLAGAALTAIGMSKVYKPVLGLQMPGVFNSWAELDKARDSMKGDLEKGIREGGFEILGWGDTGVGHVMSRGFAVVHPSDLKGKTPAQSRDDIITPKLYAAIGGVTPKVGTMGEILPNLQNGQVNVIMSSALAAEQLQWASRLTHINDAGIAYGVGALMISQRSLNALEADERALMISSGGKAAKVLNGLIRKADGQSYKRLTGRLKVHKQTAAEKAEWKVVFKKACQRVKTSIPGNILSRIGAC